MTKETTDIKRNVALLKEYVLMPMFPKFAPGGDYEVNIYDNLIATCDLISDLISDKVLTIAQLSVLSEEFMDLTMVLALLISTPEQYVEAHNFLYARTTVALENSIRLECYEASANLQKFITNAF